MEESIHSYMYEEFLLFSAPPPLQSGTNPALHTTRTCTLEFPGLVLMVASLFIYMVVTV